MLPPKTFGTPHRLVFSTERSHDACSSSPARVRVIQAPHRINLDLQVAALRHPSLRLTGSPPCLLHAQSSLTTSRPHTRLPPQRLSKPPLAYKASLGAPLSPSRIPLLLRVSPPKAAAFPFFGSHRLHLRSAAPSIFWRRHAHHREPLATRSILPQTPSALVHCRCQIPPPSSLLAADFSITHRRPQSPSGPPP